MAIKMGEREVGWSGVELHRWRWSEVIPLVDIAVHLCSVSWTGRDSVLEMLRWRVVDGSCITFYCYISVRKPSADNSSSLGSKLISSNAPTYDFTSENYWGVNLLTYVSALGKNWYHLMPNSCCRNHWSRASIACATLWWLPNITNCAI